MAVQALQLAIVGPGRAGGSFALAAERAGHHVVGVVPGPSGVVAQDLEHFPLSRGSIPRCDLLLLAVPDDALAGIVADLEDSVSGIGVIAHLSGFTTTSVLAPLRSDFTSVGALHPVQSLTDPRNGADSLPGSYAAVSGDDRAAELLTGFAQSLGMEPFSIDDDLRPIHHAAASAASNFVAAALVISQHLADRAGTPVEAYARLTARTISNVAASGVDGLTGPVARGDVGTVSGQLDAIAESAPELLSSYMAFVRATAALTPHRETFESYFGRRG